jgi:hypothetical protein
VFLRYDKGTEVEGIEPFHLISTRHNDLDTSTADIDHGIRFPFISKLEGAEDTAGSASSLPVIPRSPIPFVDG